MKPSCRASTSGYNKLPELWRHPVDWQRSAGVLVPLIKVAVPGIPPKSKYLTDKMRKCGMTGSNWVCGFTSSGLSRISE